MKKAVIYARHSSKKQNALSTQDQIDLCQNYCAVNSLDVFAIFRDKAFSGSHEAIRTGFQELQDFLWKNRDSVACVICEDLSRIARNLEDAARFYNILEFLDIELISLLEGRIGMLHVGLKGTMDALFLRDLGEKTKRGQKAAVNRGKYLIPQTYGYKKISRLDDSGRAVRGLREIVPEEAAIIREIFERYCDGQPPGAICRELNRRAVPSATGTKWIRATLVGNYARQAGLLRNTLYKGIYTSGKYQMLKNPLTGKRICNYRPQSEWHRRPAPEMQIVDTELFDKAQKILSSKRSTPDGQGDLRAERDFQTTWRESRRLHKAEEIKPGKRVFHIFSGKLWCTRHNCRIAHKRSNHYSCESGDCRHRGLKTDAIVDRIVKALERFKVADLDYKNTDTTPEVRAIRKEILELDRQKEQHEKLLEKFYSFVTAEPDSVLERTIREKKEEIGAILKKTRVLETRLSFYEAPILRQDEAYHAALADLVGVLKKNRKDTVASSALRNIIHSIEFHPRKTCIQYNLQYFNQFIQHHQYIKPD